MKTRNIILLVIASFFITLIAHLPANTALTWLTLDNINLQNPSGSIWSGHLQSVSISSKKHPIQIDNVAWSLNPLQLLLARAGGSMSFEWLNGVADTQFALSLGGAALLSDGSYSTNVSELLKFAAVDLVTLSGQVSIELEELAFSGTNIKTLQAQVRWSKASISDPLDADLGSVLVAITPNDKGFRAAVSNQGGMVAISGDATLETAGRYITNIRLKPRNNAPPELKSTLQLLGKKNSDGSVVLQSSGNLKLPL